jgi:hypothetical protein
MGSKRFVRNRSFLLILMKTHFFFCLISLSLNLWSQDSLTYYDRPGIAEGPYIVAKGLWQLETGLAYAQGVSAKEALTPSVMIRKSFFGAQELRFCFNTNPQMFAILNDPRRSLSTTSMLGIKRKMFKENGGLPEASILFNTFIPLLKLKDHPAKNLLTYELGLQFNHVIGEHFALNYNFGFIDNDRFTHGVFSQSTSLCYQLNPKWGFFSEFFAYKPLVDSKAEIGVDGGILYCPKPHFQIDLSYINNFYQNSSYGSLLLGFSMQLRKEIHKRPKNEKSHPR